MLGTTYLRSFLILVDADEGCCLSWLLYHSLY